MLVLGEEMDKQVVYAVKIGRERHGRQVKHVL